MTSRLPLRLPVPAPGWRTETDVVVVGSGVAGLSVALACHARGAAVTVVTKAVLDAGSTRWAQGGIAAALAENDTPRLHLDDTLTAGAGLCDPAAVALLVGDGPARVRELAARGTRFDRAAGGTFALTREGGHGRERVAHAGGDATGAEIERALIAAVRAAAEGGRLAVLEHAFVVDLLTGRGPGAGAAPASGAHNRISGVTVHVLGAGSSDGVGEVAAHAVVLATGGLGQVFAVTTNPDVSTGDGIALALRAGAAVADVEFVQFHPTALWVPDAPNGRRPLVTEALRGEGAVLRDSAGRAVMAGAHPLGDLAPRDVVTRQMWRVMADSGGDHLFLDARALGAEHLAHRFPTVLELCAQVGVDPARDLIPVAPAAHYASGGVLTDLDGRTSLAGLYACGEASCTGVHGANRLASNSLLEGVVYAARVAAAILPDDGATAALAEGTGPLDGGFASARAARNDTVPEVLLAGQARTELAAAMSEGAGVRRSSESLRRAGRTLQSLPSSSVGEPQSWQATNLRTVATVLLASAAAREESRGCHWREDHPGERARWQLRLGVTLSDSGEPELWEHRVSA